MPQIPLSHKRAAVARATQLQRRTPDDPNARDQLTRTRSELAEAKLADYIARTVEAAPELSAEQRVRLALLLAPAEADAA